MEKHSPQEHDQACVIQDKDRGQTFQPFKGVRLRKWGSWVSEIRMPKSREKLWLGSYPTAEQAARAYDAAVYCLRGPNSKFNFPNSVPHIPSASSLSRQQIQAAAAKNAMHQLPLSPPPSNNIDNTTMEETKSTSMSAAASETEVSSDSHQILEQHNKFDFWERLFEESDGMAGGVGLNLERMPSIDDAWALDLNPTTWQEEQTDNIINIPDLWNF